MSWCPRKLLTRKEEKDPKRKKLWVDCQGWKLWGCCESSRACLARVEEFPFEDICQCSEEWLMSRAPPPQKPGCGHSLGSTALKVRLVCTAAVKDLLSSSHPPSSSWPRRNSSVIDWHVKNHPQSQCLKYKKNGFFSQLFVGQKFQSGLVGSCDSGPFHEVALCRCRLHRSGPFSVRRGNKTVSLLWGKNYWRSLRLVASGQ